MRLIDITAETLQAAMAQSRVQFGDEAILVATREENNNHVVTIAIEQNDLAVDSMDSMGRNTMPTPAPLDAVDDCAIEVIEEACYALLSGHGLPGALTEELLEKVRNFPSGNIEISLAEALRDIVPFKPLSRLGSGDVLMTVGPPGAGKTQVLAKIAAQAIVQDNQKVAVVSTDTDRAGGLASLLTFADALGFDLRRAPTPKDLAKAIDELQRENDVVLVDAGACNYLDLKALSQLGEAIKVKPLEPLLILPAGMDGLEASDHAKAFKAMGASRIIITRIDTVRRLASCVLAPKASGLALAALSDTPHIKNGLIPASAQALTKMLLAKQQT